MTRKRQRFLLLVVGMTALGGATALVLTAFRSNLVFFYSPSELKAQAAAPGQGVVVEGKLRPNGVFAAANVLAKHDERYMPREVVEALKKTGHWREGEPGGGAAMVPAAAPR
jgi:cytochrome c-type biogenesis protein CcmE